jgi:hypothetical protein
VHHTDTAWEAFSFVWNLNPATGLPWTAAEIDSTEFGAYIAWDVSVYVQQDYLWKSSVSIASLAKIVSGNTASNPSSNHKIYVSNTDWLRADEDLSKFSDIDTAAAAPITDAEYSVWDHTFFDNRVWFCNGTDEIAYYPATPGTSEIMAELVDYPIPRVLGSYGSRLFAGDVVESVSSGRAQNRVLWSAINDGTDFTSASSGSIDLDETDGAVIAMAPFTEARDQTFIGVLVVFKTDSIFHLEATGIPSDPFDKRIMASSVGCMARQTVMPYTTQEGAQVLAFLGTSSGHINVFEWNGDEALPIGDPIRDFMADQLPASSQDRCIAFIDPETNHYILCVPDGGTVPTLCFAYDITKKIWTTERYEEFSAVGRWTVGGRKRVIIGREDSRAYQVKKGLATDDKIDGSVEPIQCTWRTGFQRLAEEPNQRATVYRLWVYYRNVTLGATVQSTVTSNGSGATGSSTVVWTTDLTENDPETILVKKLDYMIEGSVHQISMEWGGLAEDIIIEKVVVEFEPNDTFV